MTAALIALAIVAAIVAPVVIADRAGRRRTDAADTTAAGQYWDHVQAAVATGGLEAEPMPVAEATARIEAARCARTASDLPHGSARRGTHL